MRPSCGHQQTRPDAAPLLADPVLANRGGHNNRHIRRPSVVLSSGLATPCRRACPFPGKANAQNKWRTPSTHKPSAEDGPTTAIQQASKQAREEGEKEAVFRRRRSCIRDRTSRPERSCCELASTLLCQAADERRIEPPWQQPGLPETRSRRPEDLRVLPFLPTHLQPLWRGSGNDRRSDRHNPRASVRSGTCFLRLPAMHCVPEGESRTSDCPGRKRTKSCLRDVHRDPGLGPMPSRPLPRCDAQALVVAVVVVAVVRRPERRVSIRPTLGSDGRPVSGEPPHPPFDPLDASPDPGRPDPSGASSQSGPPSFRSIPGTKGIRPGGDSSASMATNEGDE